MVLRSARCWTSSSSSVSVSRFAFLVSAASQNRFGSSCLLLFFLKPNHFRLITRTAVTQAVYWCRARAEMNPLQVFHATISA